MTDSTVPLIFDFHQMLRWAIRADRISADDLHTAVSRLGRNYGPALLDELEEVGAIDGHTVTEVVGNVWNGAEYPSQMLSAERWRSLFKVAGYTVTDLEGIGQRVPRPTSPLTLYRGATDEHRLGWSWTDNIEVARTFATGQLRGRGIGKVWAATIEPSALLARIHERGEDEYVVDPAQLTCISALTV